ncbi:hypothetical protein CBS101457_005349 [Exobasidium rhododendri]|nr:hypothetical protein CBS101457_005349 [Exobasidium rhododendri]
MSITCPLLCLHSLLGEKRAGCLASSDRKEIEHHTPSTTPSLKFLYSNSRDIAVSQRSLHVAGDGFEAVNGYDYPLFSHYPAASRSNRRVKSVAYTSHHWTSGTIEGDRVTSTPGLISRAANMLSPKPRLQVLNHRRGRSIDSSSDYSSYRQCDNAPHTEQQERDSLTSGPSLEVQDISQTSVIPGLAEPGFQCRRSKTMQGRRGFETIYEVEPSRGPSLSCKKEYYPDNKYNGETTPRDRSEICSPDHELQQPRRRLGSSIQRLTHTLRKRRATISGAEMLTDRLVSEDVSPSRTRAVLRVEKGVQSYGEEEEDEAAVAPTSLKVESHSGTSIGGSGERYGPAFRTYTSVPWEALIAAPLIASTGIQRDNHTQEESALRPSETSLRVKQSRCQSQVVQELMSRDTFGGVKGRASPNWENVDESSIDYIRVNAPNQDPSDGSDRSLVERLSSSDVTAEVEGEKEEVGTDLVNQSTPVRFKQDECTASQYPPDQGTTDHFSPDRRIVTNVSSFESFLSSGVDEDLVALPDETLDRIIHTEEAIEREIIAIEQDEAVEERQLDAPVDEQPQSEESVRDDYSYATSQRERDRSDWLDAIEEVTEEPTLLFTQGDSTLGTEDPFEESDQGADDDQVVEAEWPTGFEVPPIHGRAQGRVAEDWARLHGIATPSSLVASASPVSQQVYKWADVSEATSRQSELSLHSRIKSKHLSSPASCRTLLEGRLNLDTRRWLASRRRASDPS